MIDPQLKRGLLDSCVLGVLCRGESHGYKIVKDLLSCIQSLPCIPSLGGLKRTGA